MNSHPREPLSPEERELARLTARLGPQGEPSPALDAKILGAAQAAVAQDRTRRRPRWPLAMGLAASVVFAVGIAWQLRPLQETTAVTEAPAAATAPVLAQAQTADAPAEAAAAAADAMAEAAPPAPQAVTPMPPPAAPLLHEPAAAKRTAAVPAAPGAAQADAASALRQQRPAPLPRRVLAPAATRPPAAVATVPAPAEDYLYVPAPAVAAAAPPPPPAPMPVAEAESRAGLNANAEAATAMAANAIIASESAAGRNRAELARKTESLREHKAADRGSANRDKVDRDSLDRVEVTGSRLRTDLQVPVAADTHLPVEDWLERVRTRYGLGDAEAARQSLLLFVRDHPKETVPDDLEPLLEK